MPCYNPEPRSGRQGDLQIDKLTRMLCEVLGANETGTIRLSAETCLWWEKHKEEDRARLQREAREDQRRKLRSAALAKLTPEEKALFGLPQE